MSLSIPTPQAGNLHDVDLFLRQRLDFLAAATKHEGSRQEKNDPANEELRISLHGPDTRRVRESKAPT